MQPNAEGFLVSLRQWGTARTRILLSVLSCLPLKVWKFVANAVVRRYEVRTYRWWDFWVPLCSSISIHSDEENHERWIFVFQWNGWQFGYQKNIIIINLKFAWIKNIFYSSRCFTSVLMSSKSIGNRDVVIARSTWNLTMRLSMENVDDAALELRNSRWHRQKNQVEFFMCITILCACHSLCVCVCGISSTYWMNGLSTTSTGMHSLLSKYNELVSFECKKMFVCGDVYRYALSETTCSFPIAKHIKSSSQGHSFAINLATSVFHSFLQGN